MAHLAPHHYAMLSQESGITDEVIAERGYCTLTHPDDLRDLGFNKRQSRTAPALALPLWDVHGQQTLWQIRPDTPWHSPATGKANKYETPARARVILDVHPRVQALLGDPAVPLWITEGVRKGDALVTHGAGCVIAFMAGVWGFMGTNEHGGKVILPDWKYVALNNRLVYVVFDSDLYSKRGVQQALKGLYTMLRDRAAIPCLAQWPPEFQQKKWGVDDFLADQHSLDEVLAMMPPPGPLPPTPPRPAPTAPQVLLKLTKGGEPRAITSNIVAVLEQDPRWVGVLGYNELTDDVTLLACPPYQASSGTWHARGLRDQDDAETSIWLQREYDVCAATTLVAEALQAVGHRSPYHPIRDYLAGLTWDKTPRLDTWLTTYCHAKDTPYTRAVGSKALIGAVARAQAPGCKMDTVLILEGDQGLFKSTVLRILASDPWFSDSLPDLHDKDAAQALRGKWIIELGELAVLQRSEREQVKRFLSKNDDHYRPSYGRRAQTVPRHNIFAASTNATEYFKDETGNRRFWPVAIPAPCDVAALQHDRDQLWAEAFQRYQQGEAWHLTSDIERLAVVEQDARVELDDWEVSIMEYATELQRDYVTSKEIMVDLFKWENPALHIQAHTKRIGGILRRNGWRRQTVRDSAGDDLKAFKRPVAPGVPGQAPVTGHTTPITTTGHTSNSNGVTGVTHVTGSTNSAEQDENENDTNTPFSPFSPFTSSPQPSLGNGVTTGHNRSQVTNQHPPCPHCGAPDAPAVEVYADNSTAFHCSQCRHLLTVTPF